MNKFISLLLILALSAFFVGCATTTQHNATPTSAFSEIESEAPTQALTQAQEESAPETQPETQPADKASDYIEKQDAIDTALSHAKLKEDEVTRLTAQFDIDDGFEIYEVDFHHGQYEYGYDIDAKTGKIISYDKDFDD